ncbi:MAG: hypothetical protein C0391_02465 [Anaerolinea sp.]|nr:hypothetical protein [Anaerolinea sp.]
MKVPALLALTSHGNAPYLMAARFARALGDYIVVIPDYYGEMQAAILKEEIPQMNKRVFLSKELGDLFKPLLLDSSTGVNYARFGAKLVDENNPMNAKQIEGKLAAMLKDGIPARSLDGSTQKRFQPEEFCAVINSTLPLRVDLLHSIFFFTGRMSRLYGTVPPGEEEPEAHQTVDELAAYAKLWVEVEDTFDVEFIPRINALSYREDAADERIIFTPPLTFTRPISRKLERPGILFVPSGTRTDLYKLHRVAETLPAEFQPLVLGSNSNNPDFPADKFTYVRADIFGDANLAGVVSRGGWGTIWECQSNLKPAALVRTSFVEDPEMGHSQFVLKERGLVEILDDSISPFLAAGKLEQLKNTFIKESKLDEILFGEFAGNGFAFMADKLRCSFNM